MKTGPVFVFILSCCVLSALSLAEDAEKPPNTVIPANDFTSPPNPKTTTTATTTTTTTTTTTKAPKPTTTTKAPEPTTTTKAPKPTTTTKAPEPTTTTKPPKPTTTTKPPKPTTTTQAPKPPTTPKPTTAAPVTTAPSPKPGVSLGKYNLTTKDKQVCVMAQIGLKIRLVTDKANGSFIVNPNMTKAEGKCEDAAANLTLTFSQGFITFLFNKNVTAKNVYLNSVSFQLSYPLVKAAANMPYKGSNDTHRFFARIGHSYSCKEESIMMGNGLYLDVTQDRIQAFNFSKSNEFGSPDLCAADRPNYSVAIAVGVTLLVLIIIVVVAYLVGRRRRSDGYQSL